MNGKFLGKITKAEFGKVPGEPFLMGLQLQFCINGSVMVEDGGIHLVNTELPTGAFSESEQRSAYKRAILELRNILNNAKVDTVSELVGKPVEVEIEDNIFKWFRILTEVL